MLLYPSAGTEDWKNIFRQFIEETDKFIFADLYYSQKDMFNFLTYLKSLQNTTILSNEYSGDFNLEIKHNETYRELEPAYFTIKILYKNIQKEIVFRRGFGQYALYELENGSLKYFCHRGDRTGEGGSGVYYLANRNLKHKPLSRLFDTLVEKLSKDSYIVSDGSNTDLKKFKTIYNNIDQLSTEEVKSLLPINTLINDITLKAIDVLDRRYNHTLIWKVEKKI